MMMNAFLMLHPPPLRPLLLKQCVILRNSIWLSSSTTINTTRRTLNKSEEAAEEDREIGIFDIPSLSKGSKLSRYEKPILQDHKFVSTSNVYELDSTNKLVQLLKQHAKNPKFKVSDNISQAEFIDLLVSENWSLNRDFGLKPSYFAPDLLSYIDQKFPTWLLQIILTKGTNAEVSELQQLLIPIWRNLAVSRFGNYLAQISIELAPKEVVDQELLRLAEDDTIVVYSCHRNASFVLRSMITRASLEANIRVGESLLENGDRFSEILIHPNGANILNALLSQLDQTNQKLLTKAVIGHINSDVAMKLILNDHSARLVQRLVANMDEEEDWPIFAELLSPFFSSHPKFYFEIFQSPNFAFLLTSFVVYSQGTFREKLDSFLISTSQLPRFELLTYDLRFSAMYLRFLQERVNSSLVIESVSSNFVEYTSIQLRSMSLDPYASRILQTLLRHCSENNSSRIIKRMLLDEQVTKNDILSMANSQPSAFILDIAIRQNLTARQFLISIFTSTDQMWAHLYSTRAGLCVVQSILESAKDLEKVNISRLLQEVPRPVLYGQQLTRFKQAIAVWQEQQQ